MPESILLQYETAPYQRRERTIRDTRDTGKEIQGLVLSRHVLENLLKATKSFLSTTFYSHILKYLNHLFDYFVSFFQLYRAISRPKSCHTLDTTAIRFLRGRQFVTFADKYTLYQELGVRKHKAVKIKFQVFMSVYSSVIS